MKTLFFLGLLSMSSAVQAEEPPIDLSSVNLSSIEGVKHLRDPFHPMELVSKILKPKPELEQYPIDQFTIIAVITGPKKLRAMVGAPSGKNHIVSESDRIGIRNGKVKKITTNWVQVQEKIVNALGEEEPVTTYIRFKKEGRPGEAQAPESNAAGG